LTQSEFPQARLPGITGSPFSCIGVVKSEAYLPCQGRQAPIFVVLLALQDSQKSLSVCQVLMLIQLAATLVAVEQSVSVFACRLRCAMKQLWFL
jgi:hypothetical protein